MYTEDDLANYASIVKQTHVLYRGNDPTNEHRWNKSNKWKYILKPIWEEIQQEELKPIQLFHDKWKWTLFTQVWTLCKSGAGRGEWIVPNTSSTINWCIW